MENKNKIDIDLKLYAKKYLGFILIFLLLNISLGFITKKIFFSQKTGKNFRITYSIYKDTSDVIIMGSSHANRHYIPDILEKDIDLTFYNAGVQGQQIIFQTALQKMILTRHTPKLIILNIDDYWLFESPESYDRLADLHPYYSDFKTELDPFLSINSKFHAVKLLSNTYQTNSTLVHAVKYFFQPQPDYKGYMPLYGKMEETLSNTPNGMALNGETNEEPKIDHNFVAVFEEFIQNAKSKEVELIFVISPRVFRSRHVTKSKSLGIMKSKCLEYDIPLADFSNDPIFIEQYHLFSDPSHLNNDGAVLVSSLLADFISKKINL